MLGGRLVVRIAVNTSRIAHSPSALSPGFYCIAFVRYRIHFKSISFQGRARKLRTCTMGTIRTIAMSVTIKVQPKRQIKPAFCLEVKDARQSAGIGIVMR